MMAKRKQKLTWQNRIVETGEKAAKDFNFNPGNWRLHGDPQRAAIDGVLQEIGWVIGVIENRRTGNLIDGHLRIEQAKAKDPKTLVPYTLVDLSPDEEKKILMVLDPIGSMATMDAENFSELAAAVGFESEALLDLVASMSGENEQLGDEPNLNDPNFSYENKFGVIVECDDEQHQKRVFDELVGLGHKVKVVVV